MRKEIRNTLIIAAIMFIAFGFYDYFKDRKRDSALKDGTVIIAKVTDIGGGRGSFTVNVDYNYNGIVFHNTFDTYQIDSLKRGEKIRILMSKQYPDKYIQYIGVANK